MNCLIIGLKRAFTRFWSCDLDGAYYASHFNREPVFPEKNLLIHTFGIRAKRAKRATNPCLMLTCHGLCRYTTDIRNNYFHRTFRAIPTGTPETCECQVNDDLICLGFTYSLFLKFGRAESPDFGYSCTPDRISDKWMASQLTIF